MAKVQNRTPVAGIREAPARMGAVVRGVPADGRGPGVKDVLTANLPAGRGDDLAVRWGSPCSAWSQRWYETRHTGSKRDKSAPV